MVNLVDPNTLYTDFVKIGEGASGSVFSAVEIVCFFLLLLLLRVDVHLLVLPLLSSSILHCCYYGFSASPLPLFLFSLLSL